MTGAPQRTLYRQAARFEREGMISLFGPPKVERHRTLPEHIRRHILALKAEHPAFRANEIAKICGVHFGRRPSLHTVKRILAETPPMPVTTRRYPPYHRIAEPDARRHAVVSLHSEGWQKTSIAAYLQIDARTVYEILRRWLAEGVPGLDDKSHARIGPRKTDLQAILTVKQLQENPELGAFRIHAKLRQLGIFLSPPGALWADARASSRRIGSCTGSRRRRAARRPRSHSPSPQTGAISIGAWISAISICPEGTRAHRYEGLLRLHFRELQPRDFGEWRLRDAGPIRLPDDLVGRDPATWRARDPRQ